MVYWRFANIAVWLSGSTGVKIYDGLQCGKVWQKQMPTFDGRRLNRTWKRARLKLFGGHDATDSWNWVAHVSEIGYKQGTTELKSISRYCVNIK